MFSRTFALIILFAACLVAPFSWALTIINSDISSNTTWDIAGSPYQITKGDFTVVDGSTLTVDPGVTVQTDGSITVRGILNAVGTSEQPIIFDELNTGGKLSGLYFTRGDCTESLKASVVQYVDINNSDYSITVSRQKLTIDHSSFNTSTTARFGLSNYNNSAVSCPGPEAILVMTNNIINFTSTYAGSSDLVGVYLDGVTTTFTGNTLTVRSNGAVTGNVSGIVCEVSNTTAYNVTIETNTIDVNAASDSSYYAYGVTYRSSSVSGEVNGNTIIVNGSHRVAGVYFPSTSSSIKNNVITVTSGTVTALAGDRNVYGIYSSSVTSTTDITNNSIFASSDYDRYIVGIFAQAGTISGNLIIGSLTGTPGEDPGSMSGIFSQYYEGIFVNNSISLLASNDSFDLFGVYFGTNYADTNTHTLKNNIFRASGSTNSIGIYKDNSCAADIDNSYNLISGFDTVYSGLQAGSGDLITDPVYIDNSSDLHIQDSSPAIDAGDWDSIYSSESAPNGGRINMGVYGNSAEANSSVIIVAPEITTNSGTDFSQTTPVISLQGRTSSSTQTLQVNGSTSGVTYTLGETSWTYTGTLSLGVNVFQVKAMTAGSVLSEADIIQVTYNDVEVPTLSSVSPVDASSQVDITTDIVAEFSEPIDTTTISSATFIVGNEIAGTYSYSGNTVTFTPQASLNNGILYTVILTTGIKDLAGNALASDYEWSFTTAAETDTTAPLVVSVSPADNLTSVDVESLLEVVFNEEMDDSTLTLDNFTVVPTLTGSLSYSAMKLSFTPDQPMEENTTYEVTLGFAVKDISGNSLGSNYQWSFLTKPEDASGQSEGENDSGGTAQDSQAASGAGCSLSRENGPSVVKF